MNRYKQETMDYLFVLTLIVVGLMLVTPVLWTLGAGEVIGFTWLEHKVFENSHQYQEAEKLKSKTYSAELAEIEVKLRDETLDKTTRMNLEAKAASLRIMNSN